MRTRGVLRVVGVMFLEGLTQSLHSGQNGPCGIPGAGSAGQTEEPGHKRRNFSYELPLSSACQDKHPPEDLHQVFAGGRPQTRHHALQPADALRRRGDGSDEQVLLLQVAPPRQRGGWSEGGGLQRMKEGPSGGPQSPAPTDTNTLLQSEVGLHRHRNAGAGISSRGNWRSNLLKVCRMACFQHRGGKWWSSFMI